MKENSTFTETENDKGNLLLLFFNELFALSSIMCIILESVKFLETKSLKDIISPADQALAENLKLPLSFYLYKSKQTNCKGCAGCEYDSDDVSDNCSLRNLNIELVIVNINI